MHVGKMYRNCAPDMELLLILLSAERVQVPCFKSVFTSNIVHEMYTV